MELRRIFVAMILGASAAIAQQPGIVDVAVTFSATPAFAASGALTNFSITLTGNVTSSTFTSPDTGVVTFRICQDSTGGRTFAPPSNFVGFPVTSGLLTLDLAPTRCSGYVGVYDKNSTNVMAVSSCATSNPATPGAVCGLGAMALGSYPAAGVPTSNGGAWGASYNVGTAANDLVQLNGSAQLPALSAANLFGFPTFNQSTTGNAATATALASAPTLCGSGLTARGVDVGGNAQGCTAVPTSLPPTGSASGDLSGAYPAPVVAAVNGASVPLSAGFVGTNASRQVVASAYTPENAANKDAASGYAGLDSGGHLKTAEAPTWNQSTTGNAATATALASAPTICASGQKPRGVDASGNATGCSAVGGATCAVSISAGAVTYNASACTSFTVSVTANITSATLSNAVDGGVYQFTLTQTGTFTVACPSNITAAGSSSPGCPKLAAVNGASVSYSCTYNATSGNCQHDGASTVFSEPSCSASTGWGNADSGTVRVGCDNSGAGGSRSYSIDSAGNKFGGVQDIAVVSGTFLTGIVGGVPQTGTPASPLNCLDVFDGSTTSLCDGQTLTWSSCNSGLSKCATWTVPTGITAAPVKMWSGGASGGASNPGTSAGFNGDGGSGGGFWQGICPVSGTVTVQVGLGGVASISPRWGNGGTSLFGTCATVLGATGSSGGSNGAYAGYLSGASKAGAWLLADSGAYDQWISALSNNCSNGGVLGSASARIDVGGCGAYNTLNSLAGGPAVYAGGGGASGSASQGSSASGGVSVFGGAGGTGGGGATGAGCTAGGVPAGGGGGAGAQATGVNVIGCSGGRGEIDVLVVR